MSLGYLSLIFWILCAASLHTSYVQGQTVSLSPQNSPTAVEGSRFQFTCTVSGGGSLIGLVSFVKGTPPDTINTCVVSVGDCSQFSNTDGYMCACVSGETRVFYINITSVRMEDDDNWRCQYSTLTSNTVSLDVHYAPVITSVHSSKDVTENTSPNIDCSSNITPGNPSSASYRWTGPGGYSKTGAVLDRTVTRTQGGQYTCTATNTAGLSDTATVNINVQYAPTINIPTNKDMRENTSPNIDCSSNITPGNPSSTSYRWTGPSGYSKTGAVLDRTVTRTQGGQYTCTATNTAGLSNTETININVQYPPDKPTLTSPGILCEGQSTSLTCSSSPDPGNPPATYYWTRNNVAVSIGGTNTFTPGRDDHQAEIRYAAGNNYTDTAGQSRPQSNTRQLDVYYIPRITITPANTQTKLQGDSLTLICSGDSNPENAVLSWMFAGTTLSGPRLEKTDLKSTDQGEYRCTATVTTGSVCPNGQLQGNNHVVLFVYSAPPVPGDVIAFSTESHTVKLSWKVTFVSGIKQQFLIEYKEDEDEPDWKMSKKLYNESGKVFVQGYVTDLKPGTLYYFRVKAIAGIGSSNFTDVVRVFTMNSPQNTDFQNSQETNPGKILIGVGIVMIILGIVVAAINIFLFVKQKRSQSKQKQEQYASFQSRDGNTYDEIERGPEEYQNTEFTTTD